MKIYIIIYNISNIIRLLYLKGASSVYGGEKDLRDVLNYPWHRVYYAVTSNDLLHFILYSS